MNRRKAGVIWLLQSIFEQEFKGNLCDFLSIMSGKRQYPKASECVALKFGRFARSDLL